MCAEGHTRRLDKLGERLVCNDIFPFRAYEVKKKYPPDEICRQHHQQGSIASVNCIVRLPIWPMPFLILSPQVWRLRQGKSRPLQFQSFSYVCCHLAHFQVSRTRCFKNKMFLNVSIWQWVWRCGLFENKSKFILLLLPLWNITQVVAFSVMAMGRSGNFMYILQQARRILRPIE